MDTTQSSARSVSLVDGVYDQIVTEINSRGLMGQLDINDGRLARSLGVSRTPVRMALSRLESEGLVCRAHGQGWVIATPTLKDIEDIFDLQEALDSLMIRKAAERITPEAAANLMQILDEMRQTAEQGETEKWLAADRRFTEFLCATAGNYRLRRFLTQLSAQWYRLRFAYIATQGELLTLYEEHRAIVEAVVAGDPDLAAEQAAKHIRHNRQKLITVIGCVLAPFLGQEVLSGHMSRSEA